MLKVLLIGFCLFPFITASTAKADVQMLNASSLATHDYWVMEGHPRLIARAGQLETLKASVSRDPQLSALYGVIKDSAFELVNNDVKPFTFSTAGSDRNTLIARDLIRRFMITGLVYHFEKDNAGLCDAMARYGVKQLDEILNLTPESWSTTKQHIDIAEMTTALAIGYDLFYQNLTKHQKEKVRDRLINVSIAAFLKIDKPESKTQEITNLNNVYNGAAILAALSLDNKEDRDLVNTVMRRALPNMMKSLQGYYSQGVWYEGPTYQRYGNNYAVLALSALKNTSSVLVSPGDIRDFIEAGTYLMYSSGPTTKNFNFADSGNSGLDITSLLWVANNYSRSEYHAIQSPAVDRMIEKAAKNRKLSMTTYSSMTEVENPVLQLLWYRPALSEWSKEYVRFNNKVFYDGDIGVLRSGWDPDATFIAFKGGTNGRPHGHPDLGSFIYEAQGYRWFIDLGMDSYTLPGYFQDDRRYTYYVNQTASHNTLLFNADLQDHTQGATATNQSLTAHADIVKAVGLGTKLPVVKMDLTAAYLGQGIKKLERTFKMFNEGKSVEINDIMSSSVPVNMEWGAMTGADIELTDGNRVAVLRSGSKFIKVVIIGPKSYQFRVECANPNAKQNPRGQGENQGIKRLRVISDEKFKDLKLIIRFLE